MVGVNILGTWLFTANQQTLPYLLGGGGVLYTDADISGLGSELNFNWQFGVGLRRTTRFGQLFMEYRFHHISNANRKDPNDSLNSSKVLVGISF
jgi:hypothetical protein